MYVKTNIAAPNKAREHTAGRTPIDPRLLVALWLYASLDNVASGRRLAELCLSHVAYQWLCGEVGVNYHTLNDFRVGHAAALDALFTQVLARLMHQGLVKINRISQDGMRIRASAGSSSFKKQDKLQALLREAREHLSDLQKLRDESPALAKARTDAAQQAAAEDRARRVALAAQACRGGHHRQARRGFRDRPRGSRRGLTGPVSSTGLAGARPRGDEQGEQGQPEEETEAPGPGENRLPAVLSADAAGQTLQGVPHRDPLAAHGPPVPSAIAPPPPFPAGACVRPGKRC